MSNDAVNYIKVKEIKSALDALWEKHKDSNTTRASLFNLVIYVKKDKREEYLQQIAKNIISKYPCRMIVITEHPQTEEDFFKCHVSDIQPHENSSIFCEVIHFEVSESRRDEIPFVVLPHLLPEKDVYLLWGDDPLVKDPISIKLENRATRTIFDSETAGDMVDFSNMVLAHQSKVLCDIGDLNWARTSPWRNLMHNAFNNESELSTIMNTKDIHITYNSYESDYFSHNKIQATYFQGWIATKMGWNLQTVLSTGNELSFKYNAPQGDVSILLTRGTNNEVSTGRILSCEINSKDNKNITFTREASNRNKIAMHHCNLSTCEMPTYHMFNKDMIGRSMMREIYARGTDLSFLKVLELIKTCKKGMLT